MGIAEGLEQASEVINETLNKLNEELNEEVIWDMSTSNMYTSWGYLAIEKKWVTKDELDEVNQRSEELDEIIIKS